MFTKRIMITRYVLVVFAMVFLSCAFSVHAGGVPENIPVEEGPLQKVNEYYSVQNLTYSDGAVVSRQVINGPPTPPPGYELERRKAQIPEPGAFGEIRTMIVPAYKWVFGCSAVSASMVAAFYDRNNYSNIYTGPTDGGIMPLVEDAAWGTWTDGNDTYPNNPLIASHKGLDGRTTKGSIDDYWVQYNSKEKDPYITGAWRQHEWGTAIGDYMKTSQSAHGNVDSSTTFYTWDNNPDRLTCAQMRSRGWADKDGTYGRKLFYEARGYKVGDCYNQNTDNNSGGFTFAMYKAEIDNEHPVLLNLAGHTVVGIGYDDATNKVYLYDTWDYDQHEMTWGGKYSGMDLQSVSIAIPINPLPDLDYFSPASGAAGTVVNLYGDGFGIVQGASAVNFNGAEAAIISWSKTHIKAVVPLAATSGPIVVSTEGGHATVGRIFTVKAPVVGSLSPAAGALGIPLHIAGSNFGTTQGASTVTIGGTEAAVISWSNTRIACAVPSDAVTGPVVVTTAVGPSNSTKIFTVKAPLVSTLGPASGTVGADVAISGRYFGAAQGTSTVSFNGVEASVDVWSDTRILCTVPMTAATGPVVVTTDTGASNNTKIFRVK